MVHKNLIIFIDVMLELVTCHSAWCEANQTNLVILQPVWYRIHLIVCEPAWFTYFFKGKKWAVFGGKKKSLYVILKRKYRFRDSNPRSMDYESNTLPLSYLACWWLHGHKSSVYQVQNTLFKINQVYAVVTKGTILNNFEQNAT